MIACRPFDINKAPIDQEHTLAVMWTPRGQTLPVATVFNARLEGRSAALQYHDLIQQGLDPTMIYWQPGSCTWLQVTNEQAYETNLYRHVPLDNDPRGTAPVEETKDAAPYETVNHPQHYSPGTYEVIRVIDAWGLGFSAGNAVKYIARAGKKPGVDPKEDYRKAIWYLQQLVDRTT